MGIYQLVRAALLKVLIHYIGTYNGIALCYPCCVEQVLLAELPELARATTPKELVHFIFIILL